MWHEHWRPAACLYSRVSGYLSLFSVVWPLTACSFLVNNWIEARSDALKIAMGSKRPIPWRSDSIGPWLSALGFLSWLGSITSAALLFLFKDGNGPDGSPRHIRAWALLLAIIFAEHLYLILQPVVRYAVGKIDMPGLRKERGERYATRKFLLQETLGEDFAEETTGPGPSRGEKITRETLEDEARRTSVRGGGTPEES